MLDPSLITEFLQRFDEAKRLKMLDIYIASFENHKNNARLALDDKDFSMLASVAHDVKSLARTLGYEDVGCAAEAIEIDFKNGQSEQAMAALPKLLGQLDGVLECLLDVRGGYA